MTPASVLRAAADLIEPEGAWCQRTAYRVLRGNGPKVSRCAGSAIADTAPGLPCLYAVQAFQRAHGVYPTEYNDRHEQPEVVAALRAAADRWDREHPGEGKP